MEVEVPKDVQFPLVLMGGEVLVFEAKLLKYMGMFENLYKDGFFSYHEHKDFKLDYGLWRLVLSFLAEYDKSGGESEPAKNSWARVIASLDLPRLYDMVRIMNYYDVEVAMRAILAIIMPRLMIMPRPMLRQLHPRAATTTIKSESDMLSAMRNNPFKIINKQYAFRREEILAVCVAYIQTHDIIQIIDRSFLPAVTSNISSMMLLITSSGLAAVGDNTYGHLGTGVENKDWAAQEEQYQGSYEFPDESEEEREQRLAQWEKWREERLAKPEWLPVPMPKHLDVISVATGGEHTLILTTDGLYGAGSTTYSELGSLGDERALVKLQYEGGRKVQRYFSPMRLGLTNVLLVGCGFSHSMIYTTQGLYVSGNNCCDQLGVVGFGMEESRTFMRIPFDEEVAALALAGNVSFVLTKTGRVYRAGDLLEDDSTPLRHIVTETRIVAVAATPLHALFLGEHGDVYLHVGQNSGNFPAYEKIMGLPPIVAIFAIGQDESFFIDTKGVVYARNESSFTSYHSIDPENDLIVVIPFPHPVITVIYHDRDYYFVTCDGLYAWRKATHTFERVDLQLSDVPICGGSGGITTTTLQKQMCCHHCGENDRASLGYNKATQRVFCHTKACLSEYKAFRVI